MTAYHVVTTTNAAGWEETGRRMARSFIDRWPAECQPLTIYAECFDPDVDGVDVRRLPAWLDQFKAMHGATPAYNGRIRGGGYDFRFDAVKFAHKVAALTDFGLSLTSGIMVWLDADIYTHAEVTTDWLDGLFPGQRYLAWLDRANCYPECGFVMYRCGDGYHRNFMEAFRNLYTSGDLFKLKETHDSFALQHLVQAKIMKGKMHAPVSLSGPAFRFSHVLANSRLSECLDHTKGARKAIGRTPKNERFVRDGNPYWS